MDIFPRALLEVLGLDPDPLKVPFNQLKFELLGFTGPGAAAAVAIALEHFLVLKQQNYN